MATMPRQGRNEGVDCAPPLAGALGGLQREDLVIEGEAGAGATVTVPFPAARVRRD